MTEAALAALRELIAYYAVAGSDEDEDDFEDDGDEFEDGDAVVEM